MASMNKVVLIGNLTRDPELRSIPSGASVVNFGVAVNRRYTNREGERVEDVDFFNIVAWGKTAETVATYLKKGAQVAVDGRLSSRSWETEDGSKRTVVEVVAENVQFLGRRADGESQDAAGGRGDPNSDPGPAPDDNPPF